MTLDVDESRGLQLARSGFVRAVLELSFVREGKRCAQVFAIMIAGAVVGLAAPWLTRLAFDDALPNRAPQQLAWLAVGIVVAALYRSALAILEERAFLALHNVLEITIRRDLMRAYLAKSFDASRKHDACGVSETLGAASEAAVSLVETMLAQVVTIVTATLYLVSLALIAPIAAAAIFAVTIAAVLLATPEGLRLQPLKRAWLERASAQRDHLLTMIEGLPAVRAAGASPRLLARWRTLMQAECALQERYEHSQLATQLWLDGARNMSRVITMWWGARACLDGTLSLGDLLALLMLMEGFLRQALLGASVIAPTAALRVPIARLRSLLEEPAQAAIAPETLGLHGASPRSDGAAYISLSNVWFRYDPHAPWVLSDYELRIPFGAQLHLDAPSGTGKSTVLRLIAGLCEPSSGTVTVAGWRAREARHLVAYVPQDCQLLEGSLRDNLELLSGAPPEAIDEAIAITGLSRLSGELPMGLETLISTGGRNLSGGQRQWLALTAAVAMQRPVLLLDEALSQLDEGARSAIDWPRVLRDRTTIFVEHGAPASSAPRPQRSEGSTRIQTFAIARRPSSAEWT